MPIIPSVFQPIRANDVQQRPIKAYKNYIVNNNTNFTSSGFMRHDAHYLKHTPHIDPDNVDQSTQVQTSYSYPYNGVDEYPGTNKFVVWNSIDHKYYRHPFDPARCHELTDEQTVEKMYFYSASILSMPYMDVGEQLKPGSITASFVHENTTYTLEDDSNGNLRNPLVATESFASASRCIFYMSFNDKFRDVSSAKSIFASDGGEDIISSSNAYKIGELHENANGINLSITGGVSVHRDNDSESYTLWKHSGLAMEFDTTIGSYGHIRIPNNERFDSFTNCDDWSIGFWIQKQSPAPGTHPSGSSSYKYILTKGGVKKEMFYDTVQKLSFEGDTERQLPHIKSSFAKVRTPFMIGVETSHNEDEQIFYFKSSNGSQELAIPASVEAANGQWTHVLLRNTSSMVEFFIDGHATGSSGSLPQGITANAADVMWGSPNTSYFNKTFPSASYSNASYDFIINSTFVIEQTDTMAIDSSGLYIFETPDNISMIEGDNVLLQDVNLIVKNGTELIINGNLDILGATVTVEPDAVFRVYGEVSDQSLILGAGIVEIGFFAGHNNYCLAEMRMYDYGLNQTAITSLTGRHYISGSIYQSNVGGNVFYKNQQVVVSGPMPIYTTGSGAFFNTFDLAYRGQHTIYENEVFVRVDKDHFNVAMNPTANYKPVTEGDPCDTVKGSDLLTGEFIKNMFVSGTALPYITTIGLYNDQAQMLAVAKLAQPIQKRDDVDMNFVVRWDY